MKIGIDIDDTITNSWECLIPYYSRLFNIEEDALHKSKPYYEVVKDKITKEDYYKIMLPIYDKVIPNVTLCNSVKETIDKLYDLGHKVYFITSRGKDHTDAYKASKDYLDKHHIKYEKIYTDVSSKDKVCLDEGISLFIDDSYKHCKSVKDINIDVLMPERYYNKDYNDIPHFNDWQYVYDYVKGKWNNGKQ